MMRYLFVWILIMLNVSLFAQENSAINCADGIDNDRDGLIDCEDPDCDELPNNGCAVCPDGLSFADEVLLFEQNCGNLVGELENSLGVADWSEDSTGTPAILSLGKGGTLRLGFTNNQLSNSGNSAIDLWVFEVGFAAERSSVALRPVDLATRSALVTAAFPDLDGDGYFTVGVIEGSTTGLDIDALLPGFGNGDLRFDAIQLRDDQDGSNCSGPTTGADIDAVCAISSLPPVDCQGVARGTAMLDACGECLELNDPRFNQSCADCAGVPNGPYVTDSCGMCLLPSSPEFNASCTDCAGVLYGNSVVDNCGLCLLPGDSLFNQTCFDCLGVTGGFATIDSCGVCLLPTDPAFNQLCADCAGTPNGPAILDSCGVCLTPDNLLFNQSCVEQKPLFVPTVFSPNGDGINDVLRLFKSTIVRAQVKRCRIYDRWGGLMAEAGPVAFSNGAELWDGRDAGPGVYAYVVELTYQNGVEKELRGIVTLLR